MNTKIAKQRGIGLLEVLIALLVVSLGLLGLAKFQGSLLNASGSNKARAEAIGIAQQELEEIRYLASDTTDFQAIPAAPADFTVNGTNAVFTVQTVMDDPATNNIINVVINVTWEDATGTDDNVTLMSEIALQDIQKSALATNDSAAATAVPSPRQSASEDVRPASEDVTDPNVVSPTDTPLPARGTVTADADRASGLAETFTVNDVDDASIPYTLKAIADDSRYYVTAFGDGVLGVYVCDYSGTATVDGEVIGGCRYIQNHFGGVTLSTAGTIYATHPTIAQANDLTGITPVWSSSEVTACYKGAIITPAVSGNDYYEMPYECVYAGNCEDNAASCYGFDPLTPEVTPAQVDAKGVGPGGEFGNLGLIGLDGANNGDQICFLEDTPSSLAAADPDSEALLNGRYKSGGGNFQYNEDYLLPVTTRTYVTRRLMSNGEERSEGINKSFRNHNFLLVDRANNADTYKNCYEAVNENGDTLSTYVLAPRNIVRVRTDTGSVTNPVEPVSPFVATMPAITVNSDVTGDRPNLYIPEVGSCYVKSDNSNYACVVPSNYQTDVTIYGKSVSVPTPTGADPAVPGVYDDCTFDVDLTEVGNIDSPTLPNPLFDCRWGTSDFN